jgi:hypothetical protein
LPKWLSVLVFRRVIKVITAVIIIMHISSLR